MALTSSKVCLIVEDDPMIMWVASDFLEDDGFEVLKASDASDALCSLDTNHEIGFVFTDVNMPGAMNGLALAELVNERWPAIEIVVTSGRVRPSHSELPSGSRFLPKPYSRQELLDALNGR